MKIYEITMDVFLKKELKLPESYAYIGKAVAFAFSFSKEEHYSRHYKPYVYSGMGYVKDKVYKPGNYKIKIRTLEESLVKKIRESETEIMRLTPDTISSADFDSFRIPALITRNPVFFVKKDKKYWVQEDGKEELVKLLIMNGDKKLSFFLNENGNEHDFIEYVEVLNKYPVCVNYKEKGIRPLGNKMKIIFKQDSVSQKIAKIFFATGVGIKNASLGGGFSEIVAIKSQGGEIC